jgi:hypothetical protein
MIGNGLVFVPNKVVLLWRSISSPIMPSFGHVTNLSNRSYEPPYSYSNDKLLLTLLRGKEILSYSQV